MGTFLPGCPCGPDWISVFSPQTQKSAWNTSSQCFIQGYTHPKKKTQNKTKNKQKTADGLKRILLSGDKNDKCRGTIIRWWTKPFIPRRGFRSEETGCKWGPDGPHEANLTFWNADEFRAETQKHHLQTVSSSAYNDTYYTLSMWYIYNWSANNMDVSGPIFIYFYFYNSL